jgi:glycosyltransferase involved in cell wall biosynthesis
MSNSKRVVHLTSAHPRYDTRIFLKECRSLASAGYDVSLIVADGLPDEVKDDVKIYGVKKETNRFSRMIKSPKAIYEKARELNADIYHLHDPELIPIGLKIKKNGKKVIFDSHEDVPMQILSKPYLNSFLLRVISKIYSTYEKNTLKKLDFIITATPFIRDKIARWHISVTDINNYPILGEFDIITDQKPSDVFFICYVGGITEIRGIRQMVKALEYCKTNVRLKLAGNFFPLSLREEVMRYKGWEKVDELGFLDREAIRGVYSESVAGLVTLLPIQNYLDSLPVKMFEYMSSGMVVIASDFPLFKEIIEKNECGICIDPNNPNDIAAAIDHVVVNSGKTYQMGQNGRRAVKEKYNWAIEEKKLIKTYQELV